MNVCPTRRAQLHGELLHVGVDGNVNPAVVAVIARHDDSSVAVPRLGLGLGLVLLENVCSSLIGLFIGHLISLGMICAS